MKAKEIREKGRKIFRGVGVALQFFYIAVVHCPRVPKLITNKCEDICL